MGMMIIMSTEKEKWHLSKEIPIGIALILVLYLVILIWQIFNIENQLPLTKKFINDIETEISEQHKDMLQIDARLVRIEEDVLHMRNALDNLLPDQRRFHEQ